MFANFSPDSSRLATLPRRKGVTAVHQWNTATGERIGAVLNVTQAGFVHCAAFSPDNRRLAIAYDDGGRGDVVHIWDSESGLPLDVPAMKHDGYVRAISYSANGAKVLTWCSDDTVGLWDAATGVRTVAQLPCACWAVDAGKATGLTDLSEHPDAAPVRRFLSGCVREHPGLGNGDGGYSPDCARIVGPGKDVYAYIWNVSPPGIDEPRIRHEEPLNTAYYSPSGRRIVTASDDGTAGIWDAATGERLVPPLDHGGCVRSASFSPDEMRVVTVGDDDCARLWDVATGESVGPDLPHRCVRNAFFSPDSTRVVTCGWDWGEPDTAQIWDADSGAAIGAQIVYVA